MRLRRALAVTWIPLALLLALGGLSMAKQWGGPILWDPDALFYQAHVLELRGAGETEALQQVFEGPLAERARRLEADRDVARVADPAWWLYSERFYERRWLLPLLAAGLDPLLGLHSLETLSLIAYVLFGPLLYLLLRRRFPPGVSLAASVVMIAFPPVRDWAVFPLADSAGLALLVAALLSAMLILERGPRWLPLWLGCVLTLSITRDTAFIPVVAAGILAVFVHDRRTVVLALSGAAAALPAPLLFGASARESIAYAFAEQTIPADTSWGYIFAEYVPNIGRMAERYADYAVGHPHVVLPLAAGVACAFLLAPRGDPFFLLLRATFAGYLLTLVLAPAYSVLRYELVLAPLMATGVALAITHVRARAPDRFARLARAGARS